MVHSTKTRWSQLMQTGYLPIPLLLVLQLFDPSQSEVVESRIDLQQWVVRR